MVPAPNEIKREGASRRIDVTCNVAGPRPGERGPRDRGAGRALEFDREYHPEFLGEYAAREESRRRLLALAALSLLGILLIIHADFRSVRLTALVVLTLPFALIGGVFGAVMGGGVLSLGSLVGFVTVLGIAARNGIMLVSHYRHLEDRGRRAVRPRPGDPRLRGTAGADLDDRPGHRPGARPSGHRRQQAGPRDRAPDGRRDPRRSGHLDVLNLCLMPALYLAFGRTGRPPEDEEGSAGQKCPCQWPGSASLARRSHDCGNRQSSDRVSGEKEVDQIGRPPLGSCPLSDVLIARLA